MRRDPQPVPWFRWLVLLLLMFLVAIAIALVTMTGILIGKQHKTKIVNVYPEPSECGCCNKCDGTNPPKCGCCAHCPPASEPYSCQRAISSQTNRHTLLGCSPFVIPLVHSMPTTACYYLTANIDATVVPDGVDVVLITTGDVTIYGEGFSILVPCTSNFIYANNGSNVRLQDITATTLTQCTTKNGIFSETLASVDVDNCYFAGFRRAISNWGDGGILTVNNVGIDAYLATTEAVAIGILHRNSNYVAISNTCITIRNPLQADYPFAFSVAIWFGPGDFPAIAHVSDCVLSASFSIVANPTAPGSYLRRVRTNVIDGPSFGVHIGSDTTLAYGSSMDLTDCSIYIDPSVSRSMGLYMNVIENVVIDGLEVYGATAHFSNPEVGTDPIGLITALLYPGQNIGPGSVSGFDQRLTITNSEFYQTGVGQPAILIDTFTSQTPNPNVPIHLLVDINKNKIISSVAGFGIVTGFANKNISIEKNDIIGPYYGVKLYNGTSYVNISKNYIAQTCAGTMISGTTNATFPYGVIVSKDNEITKNNFELNGIDIVNQGTNTLISGNKPSSPTQACSRSAPPTPPFYWLTGKPQTLSAQRVHSFPRPVED